MSPVHRFGGRWHLPAPVPAVRDVVVDLERYPEWWPQVLAVASLGPDDAWVVCRSVLPYTLDLRLHAVSRDAPVLEVAVTGDLEGFVRWRLTDEPPAEPAHPGGTRLDLEQEVRVTGVLGAASRVARPLLRWNHGRMMAGGVAGLRDRLRAAEPRRTVGP